jgi:methionine-rich copper-binding protein CopC
MRRMRRRMALAGPAFLLAVGGLVRLPESVVLAHANLLQADPPPGPVDALPPLLTLIFDSALYQGSRARLLDTGGSPIDGVSSAIDPADATRLLVTVPPLGDGAYTVSWTSVAADDGHEQSSFYPLLVNAPSLPISMPVPAPDVPPPADLRIRLEAWPDDLGVLQWQATLGGPSAPIVQRVTFRFVPPYSDLGIAQVVARQDPASGAYLAGQAIAIAGDWETEVIVRRQNVADDVRLPFIWTASLP